MESCYSNPFTLLPQEILKSIVEQVDAVQRKKLSLVDQMLYNFASRCIQSICFSPPYPGLQGHSRGTEDILVRLIRRFPNAHTLTLGTWGNWKLFSKMEEKQLLFLINHLNENSENHPLSHIKKIVIWELNILSSDLNEKYTKALSHLKLESIVYNLLSEKSHVYGQQVQPILKKALVLKKFKLNCQIPSSIGIEFTNQKELISAKFNNFGSPISTLESLKSCPLLETLVVNDAFDSREIKSFILRASSKKLNRLELSSVVIDSDEELKAITKKFPNLSVLNISLGNITGFTFQILWEAYPRLRKLTFGYITISNNALDQLTKNLSFLEELKFFKDYPALDGGVSITGKQVASSLKNCPKLQVLTMKNLTGISPEDAIQIVQYGQKITQLKIEYCGKVDFKDIHYLAANLKALHYFHIYGIEGITEEDKNKLKQEFPFIS